MMLSAPCNFVVKIDWIYTTKALRAQRSTKANHPDYKSTLACRLYIPLQNHCAIHFIAQYDFGMGISLKGYIVLA